MEPRLVAPIAVVALAAIAPASASAATSTYTGTFAGGGTLSFKAVTKPGRTTIKGFGWSSVPVTCTQGRFTNTAELPVSIRVAKGAFSYPAIGTYLIQSVSGHFTNQRRQATGTLNVSGILGLGETGCHTDTSPGPRTATERPER